MCVMKGLGAKSTIRQSLGQEYYQLTMDKEVLTFVQIYANLVKNTSGIGCPPLELIPLLSAWPFAQWSIDQVGSLPKSTGQRTFIIVIINYFSKQIGPKTLAITKELQVMKIFKSKIISSYGIPKIVVSDNDSQFVGRVSLRIVAHL